MRLNTAIVQSLELSTTPKTVSFELEGNQSLLELVDLCLKPHLAGQSIPSPDLRIWPAALFQQTPVTPADLNEASLRVKLTQALSSATNMAALSQYQLKQLSPPPWQTMNVTHLVIFPEGAATFQHRGPPPPVQAPQQETALPAPPPPAGQSSQSLPAPGTHSRQHSGAPQNHLPFLQYLSMSQPSATVDHMPFLQNLPSAMGAYGLPNAQVNTNLDPMLAGLPPPGVRPNMGMPLQSNGQASSSHMRSSLGMPRDARQDIQIGSSGSIPHHGAIRQAPDDDRIHQPAEKRPRISDGSTSSRRSSGKMDGPRYTCDEKHENDETRVCGASFARPYDLNRHKSTKHGIGPSITKSELACHVCNRIFSRRDALLRHQRVKNHGTTGSPPPSSSVSYSTPQDTAHMAASILGVSNGSS